MYTTYTQNKQLLLFDIPVSIAEYLLIISPPFFVKNKIDEIKKLFGLTYGSRHALNSIGHITLAAIRENTNLENNIIEKISSVCEFYKKILVKLNGFKGFEPHTIYAGVERNNSLESLHYDLMETLRRNAGHYTPHLTIARKLSLQQYHKALAEYESKSFHESFTANGLLLLKRDGEDSPYRKVKEFRFGKVID